MYKAAHDSAFVSMTRLAALLAVACHIAGCNASLPRSRSHTEIRGRTSAQFALGTLFKPSDQASDEASDETPAGLIRDLAPIIVQQVAAGRAAVRADERIGAATGADDGGYAVDPSRPTVYAEHSTALLHARDYKQITYVWWYPPSTTRTSHRPARWRGVRMTLNAAGAPVIWELLGSANRRAVIFVADSVERAASEEYGGVLPGRIFAVESDIAEQTDVVVARVLRDGPLPMGPFVYVATSPPEITTVLCRCMDSQLDDATDGVFYMLRPLSEIGGTGGDSDSGGPAARGSLLELMPEQPGINDPSWLERALRLPGVL